MRPFRWLREAAQPAGGAALREADVSSSKWSGDASAYTPAQWRRACLIDTGTGAEDSKDRYKLPVREPGGALNRNGIHAAAGGHGVGSVSGVSADAKRAAAKKLVSLYRNTLSEDPPASLLTAAGQSESAAPAGTGTLVELAEAYGLGAPQLSGTGDTGRRRYRALLIEGNTWGRGSGVFYPEQVLERDGPQVWPAGTQMFLDHPTLNESEDRPERSLRDLAGKIVSTPAYDRKASTPGLYADVEVYPHYAPVVEAMAGDIGLSIRAGGTVDQGQAAGRVGPIVTRLTEGRSVDFVTKAGAGGKLVQLLESARDLALNQPLQEAAGIATWLESRLHATLTDYADDLYGSGRVTRKERIALSSAIGDALDAYTASIRAAAPQLYTRDQWGDPAVTAIDPDGDGDEDVPGGNDPDGDADQLAAQRAMAAAGGPMIAVEAAQPGGEAFIPAADHRPVAATDHRPVRISVGGRSVADAVRGRPAALTEAATTSTPRPVTAGSPPPAHHPSLEESMSNTAGPEGGGQAGTGNTGPAATTTVTEAVQPGGVQALPPEVQHALTESARQNKELADRFAVMEAERATERAENQRLRAENTVRTMAARALSEADLPGAMHSRVIDRVTQNVALTEAGQLDTDAATARITEVIESERLYAAELLEAAGAGVPRGLTTPINPAGQTAKDPEVDLTEALAGLPGMNPEMAALAAKGR